MFKLKLWAVYHDIAVLKKFEEGKITPKMAMEYVEYNNEIKFESVDQFIKWANGLGYLREQL